MKALDYDQERTEVSVRSARWALLAGILVNPLFLFVDSAAGTESWNAALLARGLCELCMLACLVLILVFPPQRRGILVVAAVCLLSLSLMLAYLRSHATVQVGLYDWGLALVLLSLVLFFPVTVIEFLIATIPCVAIYVVGVALSRSTGVELIASLVAMASPLAIGVAAAVLLEAGRQRAFRYRDRVHLLNRKLADANERLENTNQAMSDFMAICSHDLKNKLNAITNAAELLKRYGPKMNEVKRVGYLESIDEESEAMARLIRDFLDLAALESGSLVLERQDCSLGDVARAAERTANLAAANREVSITIALEPDLPTISADPDRLIQVVDNLVGNAVRHSPDGGTVRIAAASMADGWQCIEVADQGEGVSEGDRERIFKRFVAGEQRGSAGLGLAIVKQLVELHGGRVQVCGEPGEGARFQVLLPSTG